MYKRVQQFVKNRLQNWSFDVDANRETLAAQGFGRRGVRYSAPPPKDKNPNLVPIGNGFGFVLYFDKIAML